MNALRRSNWVGVMVQLGVASWILLGHPWASAQQGNPTWQQEVRSYAQAKDWTTALAIVDREIDRSPRDMDIRAWRARILTWSGQLAEAEREYRHILAILPNDPDDWLGLANVYSRQGRQAEALQALNHAVDLDPNRADIRVARVTALRAAGLQDAAKLELQRALELDPGHPDWRAAVDTLDSEAKHEFRVGVNTDLFNFADANHDGAVTLTSGWTPQWATTLTMAGYDRGGMGADKLVVSATRKSQNWGALTAGGAIGRDNGVIPKHEGFFEYDQGFGLHRAAFLHGLEIVYGQHWYWYSTARILTISETTMFYLPRDWTWSLGLTGAHNQFYGTDSEWRPSGMTRVGFPLASVQGHRVGGTVLFAVGTENFALVDQIGRFSAHTYSGSLRLQLAPLQDVTGFAAYQRRSQDRTEVSLGFTYGIRF